MPASTWVHAEVGGEALDGDDRLAGVDEPVEQAEQAEQLLDDGGMEAGGQHGEDAAAALEGGGVRASASAADIESTPAMMRPPREERTAA